MADANAPATAAAPTPIKRKLLDKNFQLVEFAFRRWSAVLDEAQTIDDVLDPTFLANQANKIMGHDKTVPKGRGDIIEVRKMDTGAYYEVLITEIGPGFVKTMPIKAAEPKAIIIPDKVPLTTKWNEGKKCHEVIRRADKSLMRSGFQTQASAAAWIEDHLKLLAA